MKLDLEKLMELLKDLEEYFDNKVDVVDVKDIGGHIEQLPNREMRFQTRISQAITSMQIYEAHVRKEWGEDEAK